MSEPPPLTEEELRQFEDRARAFQVEPARLLQNPEWRAQGMQDVLRLVAELRRLREELASAQRVGAAASGLYSGAYQGQGAAEARLREAEAQLSRLRSEEWLEKAAEEIHREADQCAPDATVSEAEVLAILRKHRAASRHAAVGTGAERP